MSGFSLSGTIDAADSRNTIVLPVPHQAGGFPDLASYVCLENTVEPCFAIASTLSDTIFPMECICDIMIMMVVRDLSPFARTSGFLF
jgi:hypothetical protein